MIIRPTGRKTPGYLGQIAYGLLQFDATDNDRRKMHFDEDGRFVFRDNCDLTYVNAYGTEADIAQWVENCLMSQYLYGQGQREGAVYTHTFTLSWHPADDVTPEQAIAAAREFASIFLVGHGTLFVRHFDRANKHVDVVISAWRELDLTEERPWMRRGKDGQVIASDIKAGGKIHWNKEMITEMNEYAYQTSLANGWVAVDINERIRQNKDEQYENFTVRVRDTLVYLADVSASWRDFYALVTLHKMRISPNEGVVRNCDGRWERSVSELDLSVGQLAKAIGKETGAAVSDLPIKDQIMRVACLACVPQAHSWEELCHVLKTQYGVALQHTDEGICTLKAMGREVQLDALDLPAQVMREIRDLRRKEEMRKKESSRNQLPKQEQISYVLMLADEVRGTNALCRDLYNRYRSMTDTDEILEQYWRIYFSAVDLFWAAYRARGEESWERFRAEMDFVYQQIRFLRETMRKEREDASQIAACAIAASVFVGPVMLLVAVLFYALAVMAGVKAQEEEDYLLAVKEERKEHFELERTRHKDMAKKAMRQDLSLVERYKLLRQLEDENTANYTQDLLDDMVVYTHTPTRRQKELERER